MGHHERDPHDKAQKKNRGGSIWPTMRLIYSNHHIQPIRAKRRVHLMVRMCWFLLWLVLIHCILACIFLLFELKASVSEFSKITRGQTSLLQGVSDVRAAGIIADAKKGIAITITEKDKEVMTV